MGEPTMVSAADTVSSTITAILNEQIVAQAVDTRVVLSVIFGPATPAAASRVSWPSRPSGRRTCSVLSLLENADIGVPQVLYGAISGGRIDRIVVGSSSRTN